MSTVVGKPVDRQDGRLKVTGAALYAADVAVEGLTWAVPLLSTIASGRVERIHEDNARRCPGVVEVITRANALPLHHPEISFMTATKPGEKRLLFEDDVVYYYGQYVGAVVAETLEQALHAASQVRIEYSEQTPLLDTRQSKGLAYEPETFFGEPIRYERGDVEQGLADSDFVLEHTYTTPVEHHNPMEPHSTTAVWQGDDLVLYDATQWVVGARNVVAQTLGIDPERIHIVSPFVGGGFGSKGFIWGHTVLAAMAARIVGRPVRLTLSREGMYTLTGHRSETIQHLTLGATSDGRLQALRHYTWSQTSKVEEFAEKCGVCAPFLYACPNVENRQWLVPLNIATPSPMRAPGEAPGLFAYESALDELAWQLKMDPVELRRRNHADRDPQQDLEWSGKHLLQCYELGAERFGWRDRPADPRSMRDGHWLLGWGMATATYPAYKAPGSALVRMGADGHVVILSATQDIGTGTYTTMAQIAADVLQIPIEHVRMELGDSKLPNAPVSGGSMTTASVGPAVQAAARALLARLVSMAVADSQGPLYQVNSAGVSASDGALWAGSRRDRYVDVLARNGGAAEGQSTLYPGEEMGRYSFHSWGAHFVEVRVDADLGEVRVSRVVSAFDCGRVLNAKTARSQILGGITQGIGMALMEHTLYDPTRGNVVNANLGDYLMPVNADIPEAIDVLFVNEPDLRINSLGARGLGEIGITGVAGAVANAVWHATGRRVRSLPITPDRLLS